MHILSTILGLAIWKEFQYNHTAPFTLQEQKTKHLDGLAGRDCVNRAVNICTHYTLSNFSSFFDFMHG